MRGKMAQEQSAPKGKLAQWAKCRENESNVDCQIYPTASAAKNLKTTKLSLEVDQQIRK